MSEALGGAGRPPQTPRRTLSPDGSNHQYSLRNLGSEGAAIVPHCASSHRLIDDIQVLRAVAIGCVLIQHSWFNLLFHQTWLNWLLAHLPLWCGVDLFFVISGFVITSSLLPSVLAGAPARKVLSRFWIRRAFRLWPAAWLWLALMVLGAAIFTDPPFMGTLALNLRGALAGIFAYANFRFASRPMMPYGASYPYWSLSLEEQFYIVLPPLLILARRRIGWVALAALLVQFPLAHPRLYFFLRNDGLLWGVVLAAIPALARWARVAAGAVARVPCAGWVILAAAIGEMARLSPPFEQSPPFLVGAMAALAALVVWLATANRDLFSAGKLQPVVLWMGSRSYALYLCHVPIYQCAAAFSRTVSASSAVVADHADLLSAAVGLPALALLADATYRLVETPVRRLGGKLAAGLAA